MKIEVREIVSYHSCELCGTSEDMVLTVVIDGDEAARIVHDGHFGSGDFNLHSPASAVAAVLRRLHPEAEVTEVAEEDASGII